MSPGRTAEKRSARSVGPGGLAGATAPLHEPPAAVPSATSGRSVLGPPEMIARWMQLPGGTEVTGRELSLYEALSLVGDPRRQLEVVHAYWRLAAAVAEYRVGHDQVNALAALRVRPGDEAMLVVVVAARRPRVG